MTIDWTFLNETEELGRILVPGTEAIVMLEFGVLCIGDSSGILQSCSDQY